MPSVGVWQLFDRFAKDFSLAVVEQTHAEAVKGLLQAGKFMHLDSVLVEGYAAAFAGLRYVRMLVRRTHLEQHTNQIPYLKRLATMDHLSSVDHRAIGALVGHAFVPAQREGMVEVVGADSDPDAGRKGGPFVLFLVLSEDRLYIEGSFEYGPLEVSRRVSKSAADPVAVAYRHISRSFHDFLEGKGHFFFRDGLAHLFR